MIRAWRNLEAFPLQDRAGRRWHAHPVELSPPDAECETADDLTASAALAGLSLRDAVAGLSANHRMALTEVLVENHPAPEVAARLDIPVGTVRSRVHYAVQQLRRRCSTEPTSRARL
jgi:RNA polymerase sigma-70 factor, ECF subfamily